MLETLKLGHSIGGRDLRGAPVLEQRNPADRNDLAVLLPEAGAELVADAVDSAARALLPLERAGIEARADALAGVSRRLVRDADALAMLVTRETGKTISDAKGEVLRAARIFDFFAGETLRNVGERFDSTRVDVTVEVDHRAVGVVAAITPWNFPVAVPAWKIAPAMSFGNAVVWKPSELSSATASALMDIIVAESAGLPSGVVNMLLGGGETGKLLVDAPGLDAVSFTGSAAAGSRIRTVVADRGLKLQLEMGGVNGLVVMADCDLANALDCAVNGAFFGAGQRCTATSRLIIEDTIADRFTDLLRQRTAALKIGDPKRPDTQVGPLAAPRQKEAVAGQVARLEAGGIMPLVGGSKVEMNECFFAPTLFADLPATGEFADEEIFGPVAGTFRVRDFDEAMQVLNGNRFGLSAGICTSSLRYAEAFKRTAKAGMLMVNLPTAGVDYHAPFGGTGASSHGPREQGRAARIFFTKSVTAYQAAPPGQR